MIYGVSDARFNSLIYSVGRHRSQTDAKALRQGILYTKLSNPVVAYKILQDPVRFNATTLGKPIPEYCEWITRDTRFNLQYSVDP
jgi:hypothetical protein